MEKRVPREINVVGISIEPGAVTEGTAHLTKDVLTAECGKVMGRIHAGNVWGNRHHPPVRLQTHQQHAKERISDMKTRKYS